MHSVDVFCTNKRHSVPFCTLAFGNEIVQFGYGIASLKLFLGESPVNWPLVQSCKVTIKITDEDEHPTYSHLALSEAGS